MFVFFEDLFAYIYALVADIYAVRSGNQPFCKGFRLAAERTEQIFSVIFSVCHSLMHPPLSVIKYLVYKSVSKRFFGGEIIIPVGIALYFFVRFARVCGEYLVKAFFRP